ncbi:MULTISPECIES: aspartyl protease family protein [unclassified Sphingomonas]|jgi:Aspartyl protease|uniref:aspartyl protease family protein n=2 Tax=Pseudomonadota TaxID=1224 RepID=UPI000AC6F003|nr:MULTISPECIES: aspartyl protease family protein [unclassified Sphingomonas]
MKFLPGALALLFAAMPAAEAQTAPPAAPEAVIQMKPWRTRWAMEAEIAGKKGLYLLDTGAGITLVSRETATRAGCTPWGRLTGYNMMGNRSQGPHCADSIAITVGGITARPPITGLINMAAEPRNAALDGVIGLNLFEGRTVTFDFAAGIATIESDASRAARVAGMRPLRIRLKREIDGGALAVTTAVPTKKGTLWFELDSGNGGTVLVSQPVAELVGMDPKQEGKQPADFEVLGDIRATTPDAFTPDMIMDGNLGMPFLRNWVVTIDLARGLAWIGKPPVPPKPAIPLEEAVKQ